MAGARSIKAGEAFVEMTVNNAALLRGLKAAQARLKAFGAGVSRLGRGMFVAGGAIASIGAAGAAAFAKLGDSTAKAAKRTGLTVEALSELKFAASQSDASMADLTTGLLRMNRTLADAERGSAASVDALRALGLSAASLQTLSPEKRFMALADALSRVEDPGRRAALAMMVFGRGGAKLLPMLNGGAAGIEALRAKARALGLSIGGKDAAGAERFTDAIDQVKQSLQMAFFRVGAAVAPILTELAEKFAVIVGRVSAFLEQNRGLIVSIMKIAVGVMGAGAALFALGKTFSLLGGALGIVARILPLLAPILGALLSPVGLIIAGIVALGGVLLYVSGLGGELLTWLGARFGELKDAAARAFGAIGKAMAAGNLEAAAKVLWASLKLAWQTGVNALTEVWVGFKNRFMGIATEAWYGVVKSMAGAWAGLRVLWSDLTRFLSQTWTRFTTGLMRIWNSVSGTLKKAWVRLRSLFDDEVDVQAEIARIDAEMTVESGALDAERNRRLEEAEKAHTAALVQIGQDEAAAVANADKDAAAAHEKRIIENAKQLKAAQDELDAARADWNEAVDVAEALPAGKKAPTGGDLKDRMKGLSGSLAGAAAGLEAKGTFSAMAMFGMGAGGATARIADATEETAKNTGRIADNTEDDLEFE